MIHLPEIWAIMLDHLTRGRWIPIEKIYDIIQYYEILDFVVIKKVYKQ